MASINYMTQVLFALGMVTNILNTAVRALASAERVEEVLKEEPAQVFIKEEKKETISGYLEFRDVSFTYSGAEGPVLKHISFSASPGETIGIIGSTGSGKTTLVQLVPRFYDATEGEILLDGENVNRIAPDRLRRAVAVVPQKALLFTGTIESNLRWGKENASEEELETAARQACAHSFISAMENGYGTKVGQGGVNLSGGQKQRLSIARALLKDAPVLILDDCTSALDAFTEKEVLGNIRSRAARKTLLLISQRISTVMRADHILFLNQGEIGGFGTHEELLCQCREYREMYESQLGGA
jgi:ATP-binding cassette subfamily B protein